MPRQSKGLAGPCKTATPLSCWVRKRCDATPSIGPGSRRASVTLGPEPRPRLVAASPKLSSASTKTTDWSPRIANATARFVATVVLPAPPLAPNTVMTDPRGPSTAASSLRSLRRSSDSSAAVSERRSSSALSGACRKSLAPASIARRTVWRSLESAYTMMGVPGRSWTIASTVWIARAIGSLRPKRTTSGFSSEA